MTIVFIASRVDESDSSSNDWSMDVTHIARTPERHRLVESPDIEANSNDTDMEVEDARNNANNESSDSESDTTSALNNQVTEKTSLMVDSPKNMDPGTPPDIDMEQSTGDFSDNSDQQDQKGTLDSDLQISSSNSDSDATIGENAELEKKKLPTSSTSSPIAIGKLLLPRTRVLSAADYSTPPTIAGRVAKRGRRGTILNPPLKSELENMLAKPLDVTMYFQELSAKLVKSRVKLMAFLGLRNNIDSLVEQAMN
ncbi:dentin sialophosphoprotein isoform X2 [Drosophila willistoni]|uniref:dentin sialophosphoprotein isoform X2 n=1 Tax=Drosophila willistoni TaxID=7260 RepID=UPI001F086C10|nr:dentin sialophosphoprotein isoform X2 [Drosophila willistoni]